ncbi:MAG: CsbD family protein [Candidatus Accumulibacter sp.]|uniref:CsbD family protein n=1 Tax=Accumulibacter sp. TaxID=2053492 RepID=UPI0019F6F5A5|nr:CsbD family protein [Accumulibacter sp.]MBE2260184.1 CsbD family protein [Paracoccaceae bacterium]MCP5248335.1 CsbD family protein [Accumulibacter sp.]
MNKDQVKGAAKDLGGKVQEKVGKLVGSKEQQAKGLKHQAEGKVQKHVGDVKENLKHARDAVKDILKP